MKIRVDRSRCIGAGQCVRTVPAVFEQDEVQGLVNLLLDEPPAEAVASVRKAVRLCPAQAIQIDERG